MSRNTATVNLRCSSPRCEDHIQLTTVTQHAYGLQGGHLNNALEYAAVLLGWRRDITADPPAVHCPKHSEQLVCARCGEHDCFCMGGPRFDARQP